MDTRSEQTKLIEEITLLIAQLNESREVALNNYLEFLSKQAVILKQGLIDLNEKKDLNI